jgi:iron complex outermembrane receptor protein
MSLNRKTRFIGLLTSTALLSVAVLPQTVFAQDDDRSSASDIIEEVMVYGTKRTAAQSAQDVSGQVVAYGQRQLEARQVIDIKDLGLGTPNVALDDIGTVPGVANFSIRGLGMNSSIPSVDPSVGVFIDGVYLGVTFGSITDMFDVESVEIHKGPQGVLFGRNVTGGAVLLRSRRPDGEFRVRGKVGLESGPQTMSAISIEGALNDSISVKMAAQYRNDSGFLDNPTVGRKVGKQKELVLRPMVVWKPSDNLQSTIIWEHGTVKGDGPQAQVSAGGDTTAPFKNLDSVIDNPGSVDLKWDQLTWDTSFDAMGGTFTNILGYRDLGAIAFSDIDSTALSLFDAATNTQFDQFSNELRYNSQVSDIWDFTAGGFYYTSNLLYEESRSLIFNSTRFGGGGTQDHKTLGLFMNNFFDMTETMTVQFGLRYSQEEKDAIIRPLGTCNYEQTACAPGNEDGDKWTNWSPKIGLTYNASDDVKYYVHWARSFRAGGYNFRSPLPNPVAFNPEKVDSLEAGIKSQWMDNSIRFNAAVFLNKINAMQREVNLADPDIGVFQDIANTANGEVKGIEADMVFLMSENFVINAGFGYMDDKYTEITVDLSGDGIINQTDFDLRIPRLAKFTYNVGFTYDINMENGDLSVRANYAHRSSAAYTDSNRGMFQPRKQLDAGLTYEHNDMGWSLSVYGKNLTNEAHLGGMTVLPFAAFGGSYFAPLMKGRRYGAELRFEF